MLSDAEIEAMDVHERHELARRLVGVEPPQGLPSPRTLRRVRTLRLALVGTSAVVLVPWIVHLAASLPPTYDAQHWRATWVGFDLLLALLLGGAAVSGLRRSPLVMPLAFAAGTLLVCDAWFDVLTSSRADRLWSVLSALCLELPIGLLLTLGTLRLVQLSWPNLATVWRARASAMESALRS